MTTAIEANITALCQRSRDISLEKGWLNPDGTDPRPFYTVISLFHTELSEAFEDIRNNRGLSEIYYEDGKKPCGIPMELADFVIRVAQYYGSANLGGELGRTMLEIAQAKLGHVPANDPECFITELHAFVSKAWAASMGEISITNKNPIDCLATALVMTFDFCEKNDVNLWAAIEEKEAYNRTRSHKHGGKKV